MSRSRLVATLVGSGIALLGLAAASARSEEGVGLVAMAAGCAVILFNKQFTRLSLSERSGHSHHEFSEFQEKLGRLLAVVVGLGFVAWGVLMLLGIWEIRGWN